MEGNPKYEASQDLPNVPYHKYAELIGLRGIYVDDPDRLGAAWDEAAGDAGARRAGSQDRPGKCRPCRRISSSSRRRPTCLRSSRAIRVRDT